MKTDNPTQEKQVEEILRLFKIEGSNPNVTVRTKDGDYTLTEHLSRLINQAKLEERKLVLSEIGEKQVDGKFADTLREELRQKT